MSANRMSTLARAVRSQLEAKPRMPRAFCKSLIKEIARRWAKIVGRCRRDQHPLDKKLAKNKERRQWKNLDGGQKEEKM
uniref:Uncharacterized protein n=1 Tax=Romanomermis culicivorax TaxID=13658 RepID=A0A915K6U3_ROMCU